MRTSFDKAFEAQTLRVIHNARNEVRNEEGCGAINPCCRCKALRYMKGG